MRAYQVFARMRPEVAATLLEALSKQSPLVARQAVAAASAAMKARPVFLQRMPPEKRAQAVRRALARVAANDLAEEVLAVYFLECRQELLTSWLDTVGLAHDEGTLEEDAPAQPPAAKLRESVQAFREGDDPDQRELLLQAFAAQSAIDWPELDALLEAE